MKKYLLLFLVAVHCISYAQEIGSSEKLNHLVLSVEENLYDNAIPF